MCGAWLSTGDLFHYKKIDLSEYIVGIYVSDSAFAVYWRYDHADARAYGGIYWENVPMYK